VRLYAGTPPWQGGTAFVTVNSSMPWVLTGAYRVPSDQPLSTANPIVRQTVPVGVWVPAGRYWIEWGVTNTIPALMFVPVTVPGQAATGNARDVGYSLVGCPAGCFDDVADAGTTAPQGMPFRVRGRRGNSPPTTAETPSDEGQRD
jgi:hypothetical protein